MSSNSEDVPDATGGTDVFHTCHDPDDAKTVSTTVVEAVAAVAGVDPSERHVPLAHSVNPDALDALFEREAPDDDRASAHLVFTVWGYTVVVHDDGDVLVLVDR